MRYFDPATQPGSLAELYDEALNVVQDSIMCDGISIFELSRDGLYLDFAATRTLVRDLLQGLKLQVGTGIVGQVAESQEGAIVHRAHGHPGFYVLPDQALRFRTRTILCAPLRHAGRVVAVVEMVNKVGGETFTEEELASAQLLADSAAANWRATSLRRREDFYQLTRMLRRVVDVEGISLFTLDEGSEEIHLRFSDTTRKIDFEGARLQVDQGVVGASATSSKAILVGDVHQDPRFFQGVDRMSLFSTHSIAAAPIEDRGRVLGVAEVVNGRGSESFTEADLEALVGIAGGLGPRMGLWV